MINPFHIEPGAAWPAPGQPLGYFLCQTVDGKSQAISWVEDETTARLLAVAPEMANMLRGIRSVLITCEKEGRGHADTIRQAVLINRIAQIDSLLKEISPTEAAPMAKPLTLRMHAKLIMAYDHAADLQREGFHPLEIIRRLQREHNAIYGYVTGTDKLRCAGVEVTCTSGTHQKMLNAWLAKAAARLDEARAINNAHATAGTNSIITGEPIHG
jgi:hypothetical protein